MACPSTITEILRVLHNVPYNSGSDGTCQREYMALPAGWELAPEPEKGSNSPMFNYGWGTHMSGLVGVCQSGNADVININLIRRITVALSSGLLTSLCSPTVRVGTALRTEVPEPTSARTSWGLRETPAAGDDLSRHKPTHTFLNRFFLRFRKF